jgi:hypothetical protein
LPDQPLGNSIVVCPGVGEDIEWMIPKRALVDQRLTAFPDIERLFREKLIPIMRFQLI